MKRLLTLFLLTIYLPFNGAGTTLYVHYCMGEFVNFSLSKIKDTACSRCGMDQHSEASSCCAEVPVTAKISDVHQGAEATPPVVDRSWKQVLTLMVVTAQPLVTYNGVYPALIFHPPPSILSWPLFIYNRTLRI